MSLLPHRTILAIGAVVDIAMYSVEEPVSLRDLADRLNLPRRRYLDPDLQALVRKGILVGVRGQRGGYKLAKAPEAISVYDISEAVKTIETEEPRGLLLAVVAAALTQAEVNLGYTDIHSPINGRIGQTAYTTGNLVNPASGVLVTIVGQDPIYAAFPVSVQNATNNVIAQIDDINALRVEVLGQPRRGRKALWLIHMGRRGSPGGGRHGSSLGRPTRV